MSKIPNYDLNNLRNHLINNSDCDEITLSLTEIEKIVDGKLPDFSYKKVGYSRFWYNDYDNNPSYAPFWLDADFFAHCDIENGIVTFTKSPIQKRNTNRKNTIKNFKSIDFDVNLAIEAIKKYHYSINEKYTRFKSWEHCYNAFKLNRHDESKVEFLFLHLSCYMASWGMLRNSSLPNYDYWVHKEFIKEIANEKYDKLYEENSYDIDLIFETVDLIKSVYPNDISKTDTFVTKILLGVFGCTPAYDRYFCKAVKHYKVCSATFNTSSLNDLHRYYEKYFDEFEKLRQQFNDEGVYYTPMKLLDMCFWQLGYDMENK